MKQEPETGHPHDIHYPGHSLLDEVMEFLGSKWRCLFRLILWLFIKFYGPIMLCLGSYVLWHVIAWLEEEDRSPQGQVIQEESK